MWSNIALKLLECEFSNSSLHPALSMIELFQSLQKESNPQWADSEDFEVQTKYIGSGILFYVDK